MPELRVLVVASVLLVPSAAYAQIAECEPSTFQADRPNNIPKGFTATDAVALVGSNGQPIKAENAIVVNQSARTFSVNAANLIENPVVRWRKADGSASCEQRQAPAPGTRSPGFSTEADFAQQCLQAGNAATAEAVAARGGQRDFTVVLLSDAGVCYASRHFSTEGDPIYIGYARTERSVAVLEFEKCEAAPAIPKVLVGGSLADIKVEAAAPFEVQWFAPAAQCFGGSVEFHLSKPNALKFVKATITQYERYRATLQLGAALTERHIESFGLRAEGDKQFLVSKGPGEEHGPEYLAAVVVYAIPNYFRRRTVADPKFLNPTGTAPLRKDPYFGREPVHENGAADRLGLVLGVALSQPGRRLVVGGAFEVVTGVNILALYEFVRLNKLNGFEVGDEFAGTVEDIPLRDDWDRGWTLGVSFDVRYATALFGRK